MVPNLGVLAQALLERLISASTAAAAAAELPLVAPVLSTKACLPVGIRGVEEVHARTHRPLTGLPRGARMCPREPHTERPEAMLET